MRRQFEAISPAFFSGAQMEYASRARWLGKQDLDPDRGGYQLNHIHWNDQTGVGSFSTTDALPEGWMSLKPPCDCADKSGGCNCG